MSFDHCIDSTVGMWGWMKDDDVDGDVKVRKLASKPQLKHNDEPSSAADTHKETKASVFTQKATQDCISSIFCILSTVYE